ncbi:chromate transporter [Escherichia coli]|nr:chromate transporter [Escherichia coli]
MVALCQFLPGPASSQVGIAVGLSRAGYSGALAAWAGFAAVCHSLDPFALGISSYGDYVSQGALHGLKWWLWPWSLKQYGAWRVTYARMGCESPSWQLLPASFYLCRPRGDRLA